MTGIFKPYDTTIGKLINVKNQENEIRMAFTKRDNFVKVNDDKSILTIYPNSTIEKFDHPLVIELSNGLKYIAIDLSGFLREQQEGTFTVANRAMYSLQMIRTVLTAEVLFNGPRIIRQLPDGLMKTYSTLVSSSLSMAFNLNADEVITLKVLSSWMYLSMLTEETSVGDIELNSIIARMSRELSIPGTYISRVLDGYYFANVDEFLEKVKEKIENPSMKGLNIGVFYTVIAKNLNSTMWTGLDKQQVMAMSIEHIPTFVALLVMCIAEPAFKRAGLTRYIDICMKRNKALLATSVNRLIAE